MIRLSCVKLVIHKLYKYTLPPILNTSQSQNVFDLGGEVYKETSQ